MNLFFKKGKQREKADSILGVCRVVVASSLTSFLDRFPILEGILKKTGAERWDFFMTLAGVGATLSMVMDDENISDEDKRGFSYALRDSLNEWHKLGYQAFADLSKFVRHNTDSGMEQHTAIGAWVIWNLKDDQPTEEELDLAPVIGKYLLAAAQDC